jgi:uncharacterized small protein (DUF1192 family)
MNRTDWMRRLINSDFADFAALALAVVGAVCALGAGAFLYISARNAAERIAMLNSEVAVARTAQAEAERRSCSKSAVNP